MDWRIERWNQRCGIALNPAAAGLPRERLAAKLASHRSTVPIQLAFFKLPVFTICHKPLVPRIAERHFPTNLKNFASQRGGFE
jgi:hypothetical protein